MNAPKGDRRIEVSDHKRIVIGIQARSTSKRFPKKVFEKIGNQTMLQHVMGQAKKAAFYLNTKTRTPMDVFVMLLVPEGDEIVKKYPDVVEIIQGSEEDVLARYVAAAEKKQADYIVRITADCPLIPPFIISKHVMIAVENEYDYLSNVWEDMRTAPDGFDCEIMSRRLLDYMNKYAVDKEDREHVTLLARRAPPRGYKLGCVVSFLQLSGLKLSVDSPEDLERVKKQFHAVEQCNHDAHARFGKFNIHRI